MIKPMNPHPMIATLSFSCGSAFSTPFTEQAIGSPRASSSFVSGRSFIAYFAGVMKYSAYDFPSDHAEILSPGA